MIGDKDTVWTCRVANSLVGHSSEHCLQAFAITIIVVIHVLEGGGDAHLIRRNRHSRIEEIEVRELAIYAVVRDV